MTATTPPLIHGPTAKEKKYDRQLRLWAAAGQEALEEAHILLVNNKGPSVVGIETLKNLVLPGAGSFTIVDDQLVQEKDLGVNFFLEEHSVGAPRGEEVCRYLQELNPEVKGYTITQDIEDLIQRDLSFLDQYNLIILVGPQHFRDVVEPIAQRAASKSIPVFYIQCAGFYSRISVQLPEEFPVADTHPDPESTEDLRLLDPWPELLDFMKVKTAKLDDIEDHEHGHIPYVLLLLHFIERWKETRDQKPPSNYQEKSEFRKMVQAAARSDNAEGGEENFDEAVKAVLKSLSRPEISNSLRSVFHTAKMKTLDNATPNFWILALAVSHFYDQNGVLPLPGSLPDMKAQSTDYVQLQNIYKAKARHDVDVVDTKIRHIIQDQIGADRPAVPRSEIEAFCKNAASIKLVKGSPLRSSYHLGDRTSYFIRHLDDPDTLASIYLSFLILDGMLSHDLGHDDIPSAVRGFLNAQVLGDVSTDAAAERLEATMKELTRGGQNELHNIAALTGGMVAQEVIKVITKQYVPIEDTCVFDGIQSRVEVFKG